ncbi:hypothetical protein MTO96_048573 [Rhipicephalus appendiculatus]
MIGGQALYRGNLGYGANFGGDSTGAGGGLGCCPRGAFQSGFKARAPHRARPSSQPKQPRGNTGRPGTRPMGAPGPSPAARGGKGGPS